MFLQEIKNIFHEELDAIYPKEEIDSFFYMLLEHYLNLERFVLAIQPDLIVSKKEEQPLFEALTGLRLERPIQYIIGEAHFMDLDFIVNESVLIPRPETEELVRWVIKDRYGKDNQDVRILDIGTGSGCIAIALAKNLPEAKVYAMDISEEALQIAKQNALRHEVDIEFIQADILKTDSRATGFDCIVSNPPYVRESEKEEMNNNVKRYEPEMALFVSDENPLLFYKSIAIFSKKNLKSGGALFLEINQYLSDLTKQLLKEHNFTDIELRKDMFGNDRMLKGRIIY